MKNGVFFRLTLSLPKKEVAAWKKAIVRAELARIPGDHSQHEGGAILGGELSVEGVKTLKAALEELESVGIELEKKDVAHWEKASTDGKPHVRIETKGALKRDATVAQLLKTLQKQTDSGEEHVVVDSDGKQGRIDLWGYLGGYDAYSTHFLPLFALGSAAVERQGTGQLVFIGDAELLDESVLVLGRFSADGVEIVEHAEPQDVTDDQFAELEAALGEGGSERIRAAYEEWLPKFIEKKRLRLFAGCAGWLRPDGSWAIEPCFRSAGLFSEGLAVVSERGPFDYGYIDEGGKLVIPYGFFSAGAHKQGRALVRPNTERMKHGFIDRTGAWVVPAKYAHAEDFAEGRALVGDGKLLGFVDLDGNEIVAPKYRHALGFADGLALVADHGKHEAGGFGFIDLQGQVAIPLRLENAGPFHAGFALASRNGNWGFLAPDGKFLFPPRFSQCGYLVDDRAPAMLDGQWGVVDGKVSLGILVMFIEFIRQMFQPIMELSGQLNFVQRGLISVERVFGILETEISIKDGPRAAAELKFEREIRFENVWFAYENNAEGEPEWILKDVSFTVRKGQKIAFVGPSGGGKSTTINLLLRFYDPQQGRVTVDGVDIREFPVKAWRELLGLVLQDIYLFPGSVKDNIRVFDDSISDEQVRNVARIARADEIVGIEIHVFSVHVYFIVSMTHPRKNLLNL